MMKTTTDHNLATYAPHLIAEWDSQRNGQLPSFYMPKSSHKAYWLCSKGHSWVAAIYARTGNKSGCPICSGRVASKESNLAFNYPHLLEEWDFVKNKKTPDTFTPYSNQPAHWICRTCSHQWTAVIWTRTKRDVGCPRCAGQITTTEHNLALCFPEIIKDWDYAKNEKLPSDYLPKVRKHVWWKCHKCSTSWKATIVDRTRSVHNCPSCHLSEFGFDKNKPSHFYIQSIRYKNGSEFLKFGITNRSPWIRMFEQQRNSEGSHRLRYTGYFDFGRNAIALERQVKTYFKKYLSKTPHRFNGFTETLPVTMLPKVLSFIGSIPWPSD